MSANPYRNPSRNPSENPSANPSGNPHFEPRPTPAPTPPQPPFGSPTSRSDAQTRDRADEQTITSRIRSIAQADALARVILDLRPTWSPADVRAWALNDDRPWAHVVQAGLNGALDHGIREVGGLRYAAPTATAAPAPPSIAELRRTQHQLEDDDCGHGDIRDRCALCRHHIPTEATR